MRLKRLELFGFKSFADRTVLEFDEDLVGIVGPNGCGKSNVVDAVRWVLGETRPTSMRGGEMTDVIFKGSTSRPGMSLAEVTIVFDNEDGAVPAHGAEVSFTRRVHKDGEGEYLIDGGKVRLKDVRDLLFDTGLGSRGYAVLEQGRIDAVLSANALERRAIFEEAAGISRFRQRRREAENRLKRVDQDTERLDDMLRELQSRSRSLKIQAGKAERWVTARDEWRVDGVRLAQHQVVRLESDDERLGEDLNARETSAGELRALREAADAEVVERAARNDELSGQVDQLAAEAARLAGDLRALDEREANLRARAQSAEQSAQTESARAAELETRRLERRAEFEQLEQDLAQAGDQRSRAEGEVDELAGAARESGRRYREARESSEAQRDGVNAALAERAAQLHRGKQLEASLEPLAERAERAEGRLEELASRRNELDTDLERQRAELGAAREALEASQGAREEAESTLIAIDRELAVARESRSELQAKRAGMESRIDSLLDWEREREGLEEGARALFEQAEAGAPWLGELSGLLADHLSVPQHYARALDAALNGTAQALVIDDPERVEAIGAWLKSEQRGKVKVVLPRPLNHGRCEPGIPEVPYSLRDRVIGRLIDEVEASADLTEIAEVMLCDCLLVEDLDAALALAEMLPGWRLVTPEGDVVDATGVVTGHAEVSQGAIGRRAAAAEQREALSAVLGELDELEGRLEGLATDAERARSRTAECVEAYEGARREEGRLAQAVQSSEVRVEEAARGLEEARAQAESLLSERAALNGQLEDAQRSLVDAEQRFELENTRFKELEEQRAALETEREGASREEQRARIELTRLRELQGSLERRRDDSERGCLELDQEIERLAQVSQALLADAQSGVAEAEALGGQRGDLQAQREGTDGSLTEMREEERAGRSAIEELRTRRDGVTGDLEACLAQRSELQLERQRVELKLESVLERALEDFEFDRETLLELYEEDPELAALEALDALEERVDGLKRQLDKLGPVNLEAVEELQEVSTRLGFLSEQRKDLAEAKAELIQTLETINSESERLFLEAFTEIRDNFRTIFRQLFGGGKADVVLAEDEPVLEAGIEIHARPPGRETLPIGLLSGGQRTMTALALLFSVFQSRPSPFCVLDEVDAALDDANVGRFLLMLEGFVESTQFVVVTHNKGTMSACRMLYGITMQTKGVSRNVSVELSDVDKFVPEVTGDAGKAQASREDALAAAEDLDVDTDRDDSEGDEPVVELQPMARGAVDSDKLTEAEQSETA